MAKETKPRAVKNNNLGSFVDAVTPEPKVVLENYLDYSELAAVYKSSTAEQKIYLNQMIEIALSTTKQEQFLSLGELIALNTLRKLKILV